MADTKIIQARRWPIMLIPVSGRKVLKSTKETKKTKEAIGLLITRALIPVDGWNGPYLDRWPEKNPWGGIYILSYKDDGKLYCY